MKNAWILINKPIGITSFQVINKLKKVLKVKIGHCGTLDPFASGFLLIAIGKATKLIKYTTKFEKNYSFFVKWGNVTDTNDLTGSIIKKRIIVPGKDIILKKLNNYVGNIIQVPPIFSAVKMKGEKAYKYARKKVNMTLKPKRVQLQKFFLVSHTKYISEFNIITNKGFYIRAFIKDFAKSLSVLGHVIKLKRNVTNVLQNIKIIDNEKIKNFFNEKIFYEYIKSRLFPLNHVLCNINIYNLIKTNNFNIENTQHMLIKSLLMDNNKIYIKDSFKVISLCFYSDSYVKSIKIF